MLRYATATTPLCTGVEDDGDAYFGVVLYLRPLVAVVLLVADAPEELLDGLELLDPQPDASASDAHAKATDGKFLRQALAIAPA
ncbi:MAG TPA: hypothetical protein VGL37_06755 [Solirubrobacteraceae bacterium]|jgi:hypothetical protein